LDSIEDVGDVAVEIVEVVGTEVVVHQIGFGVRGEAETSASVFRIKPEIGESQIKKLLS
jgi:hypothetical protein